MSGSAGGGDNYTGGWDDNSNSWGGLSDWSDAALPNSRWNTDTSGLPWYQQPAMLAQIKSLQAGLGTAGGAGGAAALAGAGAAGSYFPPRPGIPSPQIHPGQNNDALSQYLQALQQRQQQMRSMFLPKTAGLLGST